MNEELAWAAGFFDGEGCVSILKPRGTKTYLQVGVAQTEASVEVLHRFRDAVGIGEVRGPYGPYGHSPNAKPHYRYGVYGSKASQVLDAIWPWLSPIKRGRALAAGYVPIKGS